MIYVGKHVQLQALCGDCGKPISNCMDGMTSAFIVGHCQNPECESYAAQITIERSSMQIIAIDITPSSAQGKRIYPVMADKDGKRVWPEVKSPEEKFRYVYTGPGGIDPQTAEEAEALENKDEMRDLRQGSDARRNDIPGQ